MGDENSIEILTFQVSSSTRRKRRRFEVSKGKIFMQNTKRDEDKNEKLNQRSKRSGCDEIS